MCACVYVCQKRYDNDVRKWVGCAHVYVCLVVVVVVGNGEKDKLKLTSEVLRDSVVYAFFQSDSPIYPKHHPVMKPSHSLVFFKITFNAF